MALSNKWTNGNEIYKTKIVMVDFSKLIYRDNKTGLEAFIIDEDEDSFKIEGNGIKCSVWKSRVKSKIVRVSSDYVLRVFIKKERSVSMN